MIRTVGLAAALVLGMAACGGGGNSPSSPNPPPAVTPPPPPPPPPPQDPPPAVDPPAVDVHLALTGASGAQAQGFTGAGVRVAVVDSGVNRNHPSLAGRVVSNQVYVNPNQNDTSVDDAVGHGTWVSQILAGTAVGQWPGGVAPGAQIVSARIISDAPPEDDGSGQGNEVGDTSAGEFFEYLHGNLIQSNARVMNNSWGGLYWNSEVVTGSFVDAYLPYVTQYGGLVVFATGNSGFDNPSDTAALPGKSAQAAALEQGWLTVAALDSNNPSQLAAYSNACGTAMNYCLVAPGRVVVTGHDNVAGDPDYWVVAGTSFAAPQVSGAAALVWEAFPYFDNDMVRQTLLGTASDMGAPGPDAVFGHGLLDADAAVRGPGRFDWGDVVVGFSGDSRWSNRISGEGGLVKRGSGTLWMSHEDGMVLSHAYLGHTRVEQGGLVLDRSRLEGSGVVVSEGARLGLSSGMVRALENSGRVDLLGHENVVIEDFHHAASATLGVMVGSQLRVNGEARIDGGILEVLGQVPGYTRASRETVITSLRGVEGAFDQLQVGAGVLFQGQLHYGAATVELEIERLDVAAAGLGLTAASLGSAQRLDQAFHALDERLLQPTPVDPGTAAFLDGAGRFQQAATRGVAELSVQSLSGEIHAAQRTAVLGAIDAGAQALGRRVAERLDPGRGERLAPGWAGGLRSGGGFGADGFSSGQVQLGGQVVGIDQRMGDALVGVSLSKSRLDTGLDGIGGSARSLVDEAALYAAHRLGNGYLQGRLATGRVDQGVQRRLLLGRDLVDVASQYGAQYAAVDLEAGRDFRLGGVRLTPFVSSQWARVDADGFEESGAWGFGLRADGQRQAHGQAGLGVDMGRAWFDTRGFAHRLSGRLQWQHALGARDGIDASFVGLDANARIAGAGIPRRRLSLGLGFESSLGRHGQLEFTARQVLGAGVYNDSQATVGFRRAF